MERKHDNGRGIVIFATVLLLAVVIFVTVNTVVISHLTSNFEKKAIGLVLSDDGVSELYSDFVKMRTYLTLTVNHDDIACVEEELAELMGAVKVGDTESAEIAKSRLVNAISHLGRLSGFNIDSII